MTTSNVLGLATLGSVTSLVTVPVTRAQAANQDGSEALVGVVGHALADDSDPIPSARVNDGQPDMGAGSNPAPGHS